MKRKFGKEEYELMHKNSSNWKWIFYVNPKDPRVFVPKMNPEFGWTFNFGNKYTYFGFILIVMILVAAKILL
jgi:uncharacterized membrane protein